MFGHAESLSNAVLGYRHRHPWVQFAYAVRGVLEVQTSAGRFVAPPQRGVWIPAGIAHRVWTTAHTCVRSLYIDGGGSTASPARCRVLEVSPLLRELVSAFSLMPVEYAAGSAGERLANVLLDQLTAAQEVDLMLPMPADAQLRQLCRSVQARPGEKVSLRDWSKRFGVSEKTLSRRFMRETGLTYRAWLLRMRLLGALPGLERGERVTDVALDCGYESLSAFIAAFRKLFSATPGEFFNRAVERHF
ncbi:helix-turn-helix transcriptional regulator [Variovorax sp. H27-G14]|uniref:AraC family transcriptional regulator n=1 Tax=Variovorax sp. H27-G14 TaxID=3111914 RepID=UPI0038FCBD90